MKDKLTLYTCSYCGEQYSDPAKVILCQLKHEEVIRKNNTEGLNNFIVGSMLNVEDISDGENTFKELYLDKATLVVALFALLSHSEHSDIWYSDFFSDGSIRTGYFLVGLHSKPECQITYLLPINFKEDVSKFGKELIKAPGFKGHNSEDVRKRLYKQIINKE